MIMSDWEIRREYRFAKDKANQIRILADENVVKHVRMWEYLISMGLEVPPLSDVIDIRTRRRIPFKEHVFMDLYNRRLSDAKIAQIMGVSYTCVYQRRHKMGLPANGGGRHPKTQELKGDRP